MGVNEAHERHDYVEEKIEWFISRCKAHGMKITPQRIAIYRELVCTDEHPSAEAIYRKIKSYYPNVSLTTIYRTLETFDKLGLVSTVGNTLSHAARYDANLTPHTHLVCVVCRKIEDLYDETLSHLNLEDKTDYRVLGYSLIINGVCRDCQREGASRKAEKSS